MLHLKRACFGIWLIEPGIVKSVLLVIYSSYRMRNVAFEARLFWYMAYRTRNITREARLFWYLAYRKRNITVEACLFRFMANIIRNFRSVSIKHGNRFDPRIVRTVTHCALM